MKANNSYLEWIDTEQDRMLDLLESWVNINSGSDNIAGLDTMLRAMKTSFASLGGDIEEIVLPPRHYVSTDGSIHVCPTGKALRISKKRKEIPVLRLFLGGHMDTVYSADSPFQKASREANRLRGPGTADMKGGVVILLKALEAIERSPFADRVEWEVVINPDEEVGSVSSAHLFEEAAQRNDVGLLFEPSFSDGALVSSRKGSYNFTIVSKGKAAHSGRDFHAGKNAIVPLARFIAAAERLNVGHGGITLNFGHIKGGTATNIVPDLCVCHCNVRVETAEELSMVKEQITAIVIDENAKGGALALHHDSERGPKPFDDNQQALFNILKGTAEQLDINLVWRPSGGVCDGNILTEAGLPNIDTLGAVGGNIHTVDEYIEISSLVERAKMTTLFITNLINKQQEAQR